jgi:hypothetical protein
VETTSELEGTVYPEEGPCWWYNDGKYQPDLFNLIPDVGRLAGGKALTLGIEYIIEWITFNSNKPVGQLNIIQFRDTHDDDDNIKNGG